MSSRGRYEDAAAILYLVPFVLSGVYGLFLWVQNGLTAILPSSVYLTVTRDPYVFMAGSVAIFAGVVLDVSGADRGARRAKVASVGSTLQSVAIASLVLVIIAALYANGFSNVGGTASDFIVGRYGIVFPAMMILLSYLITGQFRFSGLVSRKFIGLIALLLVPVSVYELGRRDITVGLALAFVLLVIGVGAFVLPGRKPPTSDKE